MPALAITISSLPNFLTASLTSFLIISILLLSPARAVHEFLFSRLIWPTACFAKSGSMSFRITSAPCRARFLQISNPIPWPAPVTIATFLLNSFISDSLQGLYGLWVMGYGLWVMSYGLYYMSFEFWYYLEKNP